MQSEPRSVQDYSQNLMQFFSTNKTKLVIGGFESYEINLLFYSKQHHNMNHTIQKHEPCKAQKKQVHKVGWEEYNILVCVKGLSCNMDVQNMSKNAQGQKQWSKKGQIGAKQIAAVSKTLNLMCYRAFESNLVLGQFGIVINQTV
jgi:hypothetical protein